MDIAVIIETLKNNPEYWVPGMVTGFFAIILTVFNMFRSSKQEKKQREHDKVLESFKSKLSNKNYISKVRFDAEFQIYRKLAGACWNMVSGALSVSPIFPPSPMESKESKEKREKELYDKACKSYTEFHRVITRNASFIEEEFCNRYMDLMSLCGTNIGIFALRFNAETAWWVGSGENKYYVEGDEQKIQYLKDGAFNARSKIEEDHEKLIKDIRSYIFSLDVAEQ